MKASKVVWSLVISGSLITVACGDSKLSSMNPVAPSALVTDPVQSGASAGVSSTTGKNDKGKDDKGKDDKGKDDKGKDDKGKDQAKVELEGPITAKGTTTITVNGQVVTVPGSAEIRHGKHRFGFADLRVGDRVHIKAVRTATTLEASEVKVQRPGDDDDDDDDAAPLPPPPPPAPTEVPLVSVEAPDDSASEASMDPGAFRFTRTGSLASSLTVTFTVTGTATNGVDYQTLPVSVTFAAGSATVSLAVNPLADTDANESSETVIITLIDGATYDLGAPATATVTIFPFVNS